MNAQTKIVATSPSAGAVPTRYRLRVADYLLLHEQGSFQGKETELVDGEVFFMSPEWRPHFRIKSELVHRLHAAVQKAGLPYFVGTEGSVALTENDMPRPDISLTDEAEGEGAIPIATVPLAIEVSSTSLETDIGPKALRYAAAGLTEYWVVDVSGRLIHRFWSPSAEGYEQHDHIAFGEPLACATLPGLTIRTTGF